MRRPHGALMARFLMLHEPLLRYFVAIGRLKDGGTKGVRQTAFSWAHAQPIADARTETFADAPADASTNANTAADAPADVRADEDAAADASSADVRADAEAMADVRTMDTTMNEPGAAGRSDRAAPADVRRAGTLADAPSVFCWSGPICHKTHNKTTPPSTGTCQPRSPEPAQTRLPGASHRKKSRVFFSREGPPGLLARSMTSGLAFSSAPWSVVGGSVLLFWWRRALRRPSCS